VSLALATVTYFLVERPALMLKKRNRPLKQDVPALAAPERALADR
jgi:peptidoglycan/LPS O-acetylase OafA/YrhL